MKNPFLNAYIKKKRNLKYIIIEELMKEGSTLPKATRRKKILNMKTEIKYKTKYPKYTMDNH